MKEIGGEFLGGWYWLWSFIVVYFVYRVRDVHFKGGFSLLVKIYSLLFCSS